MTTWKLVTAKHYDHVLDFFTPQRVEEWGFLGGEPEDNDPKNRRPKYSAFVQIHGECYEATAPMTAAAFDLLTPASVIVQISASKGVVRGH